MPATNGRHGRGRPPEKCSIPPNRNAYSIGGISLVAVAQIDLFGAFCGVIAGRSAGP
jgi:hypothetical protein